MGSKSTETMRPRRVLRASRGARGRVFQRTDAVVGRVCVGGEGRRNEGIMPRGGRRNCRDGRPQQRRAGARSQSRAESSRVDRALIVQMPAGVPVGTLSIGPAGATNAALLAVAILANTRPPLRERLRRFRREQDAKVREATLEEQG